MTGQPAPLFARQPIFDRSLKVVAYELLFRGGLDSLTRSVPGDEATSHVLMYAFGQHQIQEITGQVPAYINFTRHWVMHPPTLPPQQLVVEVLEDVPADKQVLNGLKQLREKGYQIALDDFLITRDSEVFLQFADVVKIDVLALAERQLAEYVARLQPLGVKLLAEKIESFAMFQRCQDLGFDYYQGYFLSRPHILEGLAIDERKTSALRQLNLLTSANSSAATVFDVIDSHTPLRRQILRVIQALPGHDSAGLTRLEDATEQLGLVRLGAWAAFVALTLQTDKPQAVWAQGLCRARFCELISRHIAGQRAADVGFVSGLLSMLDAFLDLPMEYLVAQLDLTPPLKEALLNKAGEAGCALDVMLQLEAADWQSLSHSPWCASQRLSEQDIALAYGDALSWSQHLMSVAF